MPPTSSASAPFSVADGSQAEDARLAELVQRFGLPAGAAGQLTCLLGRLVEDPHAPTAVRERARVIDEHLADSLVALEVEAVRHAGTVADLGSGAGLPGLPLAIARPEAHVALVESAVRKCAFLSRTVDACGLANAEVVHGRAEGVAVARRESFELVTARALAPLAVVAEYAAPLLAVGGALVAWRGRRDVAGERAAAAAGAELGLSLAEVRRVEPFAGAEHRHLHVLVKASETPARFPRRPGMAVKRPLGGPLAQPAPGAGAGRPPSDRTRR